VAVLQNGTEVNVSREKRRRLREVLGSSEE
jgi:hypothetical protein